MAEHNDPRPRFPSVDDVRLRGNFTSNEGGGGNGNISMTGVLDDGTEVTVTGTGAYNEKTGKLYGTVGMEYAQKQGFCAGGQCDEQGKVRGHVGYRGKHVEVDVADAPEEKYRVNGAVKAGGLRVEGSYVEGNKTPRGKATYQLRCSEKLSTNVHLGTESAGIGATFTNPQKRFVPTITGSFQQNFGDQSQTYSCTLEILRR